MTQKYTGSEYETDEYRETLKEMAFSYVCSLAGASEIANEIENKAKYLFTGAIEPLRERVICESRAHILSLKNGVSETPEACLPDLRAPRFFESMIEALLADLTLEERVVFLLLRLPGEDYESVAAAMGKRSVYDILSLLDAAEKKISARGKAMDWGSINAASDKREVPEIADEDFDTYAEAYEETWRFGVEELAYTLVADKWWAKEIADRVAAEAHKKKMKDWVRIRDICISECEKYIVEDFPKLKREPVARRKDRWAQGVNMFGSNERQCLLLATFFYNQSDEGIAKIASILEIEAEDVRKRLKAVWFNNIMQVIGAKS